VIVLALAACQGRQSAPPPAPVVVRVMDETGHVVAELRPGHPCRASAGLGELIVGGPPIVASEGSAEWKGTSAPNGTTYEKNGERLARLYPIDDPKSAAVLDMHGVALVRIAVDGGKAIVSNASGVPVRNLMQGAAGSAGPTIVIDSPPSTVTGTDDLILASLLAAPELVPEVRMLAACDRVLAKGS
jgi:hypothetical protein